MHTGESGGPGNNAGADPTEKVTLAIATGLDPGSNLRKNRIFHLTPLGVDFDGKLTPEQSREGFQFLRMADDCGHLWLADFIAKTTADHGEQFVQETLVQLQFPLDQAQRALAIGSLHRGVRHATLTTEHYWALAHAPEKRLSDTEQLKWAAVAVEHKMTAAHLSKCIAAGKVLPKEDAARLSGRGSGVATPHGIRQAFDTWFRQVDANDPIDRWPVDRKRELLEELRPVAKIVRDLEEELESAGS